MLPIEIALLEYATASIDGVNNNPRVMQYFEDIGQAWVDNDDTAWCAAFVNWVLKQANQTGTGKLSARSFLDWGTETESPVLGNVVVLWRISRVSPFGHVGFFIREVGEYVYILGGNQSGSVNITAFPKSKVLGYRKII